jgi:FKBP-type peptidyl-prolyl cis-trans isomerase FkpA
MQAFPHPSSTGPSHQGRHRRAPLARALALAITITLGLGSTARAQAPAAAPAALHPALVAAAAEPGAVVTASGLVFRSLEPGRGEAPKASDTVRVHYRGSFPDGREFDSSYKRNEPTSFPLNRVIRCWTEGLQLMKPGGRARLTCPAHIAYGERGAGNGLIPPGAVLVFEVQLLGVTPSS